jgi:hypothetical protein
MNTKIIDPTMADVLNDFKKDVFRTMNCVKIGKIISFNGIKKSAQVQILFKAVNADGTFTSLPVLVDCPIFTLQGGASAIQTPITAGDNCLVLFSDRNIDLWFQTGSENAPSNSRCHDLSDGIVLVGLNALNSPMSAYIANTLRMFNGTTEIDLGPTLVTIKNATISLGMLIQNFITALESLQVVGNIALTPASIAILEAQKLLFATLLL